MTLHIHTQPSPWWNTFHGSKYSLRSSNYFPHFMKTEDFFPFAQKLGNVNPVHVVTAPLFCLSCSTALYLCLGLVSFKFPLKFQTTNCKHFSPHASIKSHFTDCLKVYIFTKH